jgi:hypothetical protein
MPKGLTAFGGLDALVHALESYVSVCATDYTKGLSLQVGRNLGFARQQYSAGIQLSCTVVCSSELMANSW